MGLYVGWFGLKSEVETFKIVPNLLIDVSLIVFKINDGICLLHCKDCNVCLGLNP
jgi:hypothetical protein